MATAPGLLVVGAGGFLGRAVRRHWASTGRKVMTASHGADADFKIDLSSTPDWDLPTGDDVSVALICSAVSSLDRCRDDWETTHRFNVANTALLIDRLAERGIRPVFCSSDQVFEGDRGGYREDSPSRPRTAYGRQKRLVEQHIKDRHPDALVLRMGKLFGPLADDTSPLRQIAESIRDDREIPAASDMWLTLTHVTDIAEALVLLLADGARGVWHVAHPDPLTRLDLATRIAHAAGRADLVREIHITDLDLAEPRPPNTVLDSAKFRAAHPLTFRDWSLELPEILRFCRVSDGGKNTSPG